MRSLRACVASALAVFLFVVLSVAVHTQIPPATIEGRVVDTSGAVLPGANVSLKSPSGGAERTAITDTQGAFRFAGVSPGKYRVTAALQGFTSASVELAVASGETATRTLTLSVGGVAETVTVSGSAPLINTQSSASFTVARGRDFSTVVSAGGHYAAPGPPHPYPRPWRWPSAPYNTTSFDKVDENAFVPVTENPLSTFSVDVDTASYAFMRRMLSAGTLPQKDAVRIEELVNYFRYDYPNPIGDAPFSITTSVAACPWNARHLLAHIGLQARRMKSAGTPPRNLVFLLDVSGSMQPDDKLPLVKSAMQMLATRLTERDTVAIVVYASASGVVLPPTRGDRQDVIRHAIEHLQAGGTTNGAEGLQTAYAMAREHFDREGVNRIILASDGDFNTGITSRGDLMRLIEDARKSGIGLSVLGVGDDNLKDGTLEQLADRGNGNYAYLDSLEEAHRVLLREAGATLVTVAKDVKIQVEFNPAYAASYRLIGYENRALAAADFKDDAKDAGEIGAGHAVTALYEIVPPGVDPDPGRQVDPLRYQQAPPAPPVVKNGELMWVKVRYKHPQSDTSVPLDVVVKVPARGDARLTTDPGFAAAVAAFGMLLRDSAYKGEATWRLVTDLAERHRGTDPDGYRAQFARLVEMAEAIAQRPGRGTK